MSTWSRVAVAFLVAPAVPALLLAPTMTPGSVVIEAVDLALHTYPVAWFFGLPAYLTFRRAGLTKLWHYALGGFAGVATGALALSEAFVDNGHLAPGVLFYFSALMGVLGAAVAATFWLIAVRLPAGSSHDP